MRAYLKQLTLWRKYEKAREPHVFAVGLNKTATSSLGLAFQRLGYTLFEGPLEFHTAVQQALDEGRHPLHYLWEYTAFEDIFIPGGYMGPHAQHWASLEFREFIIRAMHRKFPRARFILNLREDVDGWVDSRRKHVEKNLRNPNYMAREYRWCEIQPNAWRREYAEQKELVHRLSRELGFPLLEFDASAGDGFEKLCPFLGKAVPRHPFPNVNKAEKAPAQDAA
jgi:hypothetical protein